MTQRGGQMWGGVRGHSGRRDGNDITDRRAKWMVLTLVMVVPGLAHCDGVVEPSEAATEPLGQNVAAYSGDGVSWWLLGQDSKDFGPVPKWVRAAPRMTSPTNCSGVAVQRDVVVTAGHCACASTAAPAARGNAIFYRQGNSPGITIDGDLRVLSCSTGARDLAVLLLDRPATFDELPAVMPIRLHVPPDDEPWRMLPIKAVGWAGFGGQGILSLATVYSLKPDVSVLLGVFDGQLAHKGDSGGPVTYWSGKDHVALGIASFGAGADDPGPFPIAGYAPTFDYNGAWLAQFIAPDADGDGWPDSRDNCPGDDNPDQHDADDDGVGDSCDPCPCSGAALEDPDGDGWCTECRTDLPTDTKGFCAGWCPQHPVDNCPNTPNMFQTDSDGDGYGDACDDCMCDPGEKRPKWDDDKDGVCGYCDGALSYQCDKACGTQGLENKLVRIDTCPHVWNRDTQNENCNSDAEEARNAMRLGDACDPVPCPRFEAEHTLVDTSLDFDCHQSGYTKCIGEVRTYELAGIALNPLGSGPAPRPANVLKTQSEVKTATLGIDVPSTQYRYCVHLPFEPFNISCGRLELVDDSYLDDPKRPGEEARETAWHRVWVDPLPRPTDSDYDPMGWNPKAHWLLYEEGQSFSHIWRWREDFTEWSARFQGYPGVPSAGPSDPSGIGGRFWANSNSPIGTSAVKSTLFHLKADGSGPSEKLSNHYEYLWPVTQEKSYTYSSIPEYGPGFMARFCLECPMNRLVRNPNTCSFCGPLIGKHDMSIREAQRVVIVRSGEQRFAGVLLGDGSIAPVGDQVGIALQTSLEMDLHWVDAVEALPMIGNGFAMPSAVGLTPDGTTLAETIQLADRRLFGMGDLRAEVGPHAASVRSSTMIGGPSPRAGFSAVYSRSAGQVFVLGGSDSATGKLARDIWWRGVEDRDWHQVPLKEHVLGEVLAATRSYLDRRLWVADEVRIGNARFGRLSRIDPGTGEVQVLGTWPRQKHFDKHWMVLDRDGSILFVASSTKLKRHVVARIVHGDEPARVDVVRFAKGELALVPSVDEEGYSFPVVTRAGRLPETVRIQELQGRTGHWLDIGQCF